MSSSSRQSRPHSSAARSGGGHAAKNVPRKYCSILQYIQYNNKELYDTISDLMCLVGLFSMKPSAPGRPPRELTFLMPTKDSEMHKEIIHEAYHGDEHKCISQLGDFKQGDILRTAARSTIAVDTSGGFTKVGSAKIIADENFATLYTDAKFHVYLLESGILMSTPVDESSQSAVSGGAWRELRDEKETDSFMRTPAGLAQSALQTHIMHLKSAGALSVAMPGWITGDPNGVFYKWGVSLGKYLDEHDPRGASLARKMWSPNPMCLIPFCAMILDRAVFDAWLKFEDAPEMKYTYEEYLSYVPKSPLVSAADASSVITDVVSSIGAEAGKRKLMNDTASIVQKGYEKVYGKDADLPSTQSTPGWKVKMLYDEAVFVMNDYIRAAIRRDFDKCDKLSSVIVNYYTSVGKPWLTSVHDTHDMPQAGSMHCKLVEFALSESFMYPNGYFKQSHRDAPLQETAGGAMEYTKLPAMCVDFTPLIIQFFSGKA
jgi:hypothetical protein